MVRVLAAWVCFGFLIGCSGQRTDEAKFVLPLTGDVSERLGDEIMVAGQLIHTGAPVVLWIDPGGYDAYRVERRFSKIGDSSWDEIKGGLATPNRFGQRLTGDSAFDERVRGGGWTLDDLRSVVDQFVMHYDVCGTSRTCFRVLHDMRGLSVHFMLDIDGTIYQTLDVKERAWHATKANTRSVGIEIANIGAYPSVDARPLREWYETELNGDTRITVPERFGDGGIRSPRLVDGPSRDQPIQGTVNGSELLMYDLTDAQYDSLIKLTASLHRALPGIALEYPKEPGGGVDPRKLDDDAFRSFSGLLAHWHVQENKIDPGPAFDWERVVEGARRLVDSPGQP